jgi:GNAT superfamily N-acetyltransferase
MTIQNATSDEEIAACFPVLRQLRPHLTEETFVARIRELMSGGYRLAYLLAEGGAAAVAGYRIEDKLSTGTFLFVDDLVSDESSRSKGHGARMLTWLREQARAAGCRSLQLDTGIQRKDAQRFYQREGMRLSSYRYEILP